MVAQGATAIALAGTLASLFCAASARAEGAFDGKWRQGPLREDYTVQQWLPGCGPAPVSASLGGGDVVDVRQEGDELAFIGGGRVYRSNQCYDQLPTLARDAHSRDASGRAWRTRCATPASDPRRATMNTLVVATSDDHLDVIETGRYEISLADGRCIADVKRSRAYDRVAAEAPAKPPAAPPPEIPAAATQPPAPKAACTPGAPTRLEVRPSRKLLKTGESFAFHAVVSDAHGCPTDTSSTWSLAPGSTSPVMVDASGKVTVPADAPEGSVVVEASAPGAAGRTLRARVTVDVTSPAHYGDLLAQSGLNAAGEDEQSSIAEVSTGAIGGQEGRAEDTAAKRRLVFVLIVFGLALVLGIVAWLTSRRARKAAALEAKAEARHAEELRRVEERRRERAEAHAAQVRAHEESVRRASEQGARHAVGATAAPANLPATRMICPACRREYVASLAYCPEDASRLVPLNGSDDAPPAGAICPTCKRGFDATTKVCPDDGDELIPYAMALAARARALEAPAPVPRKGKICPTCGGRFDGSATFCGKDGTALVLLN